MLVETLEAGLDYHAHYATPHHEEMAQASLYWVGEASSEDSSSRRQGTG